MSLNDEYRQEVTIKKIRLVLANADVAYNESISNYIHSSSDATKFDIKLCSNKDSLEQYLANEARIDILLASADILPQDLFEDQERLTMLLEDDQISDEQTARPAVFKYQPLNQLVSEILSTYYEHYGKVQSFLDRNGGARVISVYSPVGGSGKTTAAVNLSKEIALQDYKVFYLNLELLNSTPLFFTSPEDHPSSQILYFVKANQEQLVAKIESLKKYHPYSKVDYFDLAVSAEEMLALTERETEIFISGLIDTGSYDFIIIDLDSSVQDRVKASLKKSDQIVWLLNHDLQSFHKTYHMLNTADSIFGENVGIGDKSILFLNHYTGHLPDELRRFDLPIKGYLPYMPEWKNMHSGQQMMSSSSFAEQLLTLMQENTKSEAGGVTVD